MKEYSLQEIFDLPEGIEYINADAHFEVKNGILYNWFKPNDKQSVRLTKMYVNMKFIKVENPVSFMEAISNEYNQIKVDLSELNLYAKAKEALNQYMSVKEMFKALYFHFSDYGISQAIKNGKWYIKED